MRLKRLELFGFKSFADRTLISFEHQLTGIVGPNGCGKSNVVDAVRWVLGETRPTSMRGGEMVDVIFKGSASRPALSVAEVALVLDNSCHTLEGRGAEVSIARRVFRSGEGEYLIDGEKVRLKDVRSLLYNTGLGSRGYSVLEQGRIDAVLSADPLERRSIFEEAAGISRFRMQRKEAQQRLSRVEQDALRLDDVLGELQSRVRSLKIQAGKAERWQLARDEWRQEGTRAARHLVFDANQRLSVLSQALAALELQSESLRALRQASEGDVATREREQLALSGELERLGADASRLSGDLRALDERAAHLSGRVSEWRADAANEQRRAQALARKLAERTLEQTTAEQQQSALEVSAQEATRAEEQQGGLLREVSRSYRLLRESSQAKNDRVLALLHERTSAQNTLGHLERSLEPLQERARRARGRAQEALALRDQAQAQANSTAERSNATQGALDAVQQQHQALEQSLRELGGQEQQLGLESRALEVERARVKSRIEALLDLQRERDSLGAGANALLARSAKGVALRGLLADSLRTSTQFARALDAVLGERAQALCVEQRAGAEQALSWLKEHRQGQVRLTHGAGFGPSQPIPLEPLFSPKERAGLHGRLLDLVKVEPGFENAASALLAQVYVTRDLASAFALVAAHAGLVCVTPEGDLVDAGGAQGGWREVAHGAVGRRASAAELEGEAAILGQRLEQLSLELTRIGGQRARLEQEREQSAQSLEERRNESARARGAHDTARARLLDLEQSATLSEREAGAADQESERVLRELESCRARLAHAGADFELANRELQGYESERHDLEAKREELTRSEAKARVEAVRVVEQLGAATRRASELLRALEEARLEHQRALQLATQQDLAAREGQRELEQLALERQRLLEARGALDLTLSDARERERDARDAIDSLRRRVDAVTRELESIQSQLSERRLELQRVELERSDLLRRAHEELGLLEGDLRGDFEPEPQLAESAALLALAERALELKRALERLGPVNMEALAELEEVSGRLGFLETQRADLSSARAALDSALERINAESERLFRETFDEIRTHFQVLFRQLFGGGKADIQLGEGTLLEAGIEISARPPGREMLPIGLLSGGQRTLTALALLFAVFQARPSPFCLLDEVDAALDDVNVGRFLSMLDSFRSLSQFVIVTHNKGTMGACQALYGITMEVQGVSRHVSVELDQVESFVPEAIGDVQRVARARHAQLDPQTGEPLLELEPQRAPVLEILSPAPIS